MYSTEQFGNKVTVVRSVNVILYFICNVHASFDSLIVEILGSETKTSSSTVRMCESENRIQETDSLAKFLITQGSKAVDPSWKV